MSYTNHTTNYNLPQYIGTDKPTYLTDFNGAMSAIDAQMKLNADTASTASTNASTANTNIGTLTNLTTTVKSDLVSAVNEVKGLADTAQETASGASGTATSAQLTANGLVEYLTLTGKQNLGVTTTQGTISAANTDMSSAYNSAGSLGKVYGAIKLDFSTTPIGTVTITIADTGLRPENSINIKGVIMDVYTAQGFSFSGVATMTINTDGTVTIPVNPSNIVTSYQFILPPCLYFMKNFGD